MKDQRTAWANLYDIYFGGAHTGGGPGPWPPCPPPNSGHEITLQVRIRYTGYLCHFKVKRSKVKVTMCRIPGNLTRVGLANEQPQELQTW